jgi:hypothetical protein
MYLNSISAQDIRSVGMQVEFNELPQLGAESLHTFSSGQVKGSQFFFPAWTPGAVTTNDKAEIGQGYVFLFDKVRQSLFIKPKDSSVVLLGDFNQIYSFKLNTDKTHLFEKATHYDSTKKNIFYEVLFKNNNYTLLKYVKTKFIKADMSDIMKVKNGDLYDEFKDETNYYLSYQNGLPQKIELKEKSIKKCFPNSKTKQIQAYFQQNEDSHIDEHYLINLLQNIG